MDTSVTLVCKFKDDLGKTRNINIDNPIGDVDASAVKTFMESAIAGNILTVDKKNLDTKLASIAGAQLSQKTVADIEL